MPVLDGDAVDPTKYSLMGPVANGLRVRKNPLGSMVMGVDDTVGDGTYWMVMSTTFKTTGQSLQIGLAPTQSPLAPSLDTTGVLRTTGHIHCDSGFTVGVYYAIVYPTNMVELGTFTRSGSTFTYSPTTTWTATQAISLSARLEAKNAPGSTAFSVLLDDVVVIDSVTVAATLNAVTRNCAAVSIQRATLDGEAKQDSPWLSVIGVSDYIPQVYLGSGAVMSKSSGSPVAAANTVGTGGAPLPGSYFNTISQRTTDIGYDLATGKFTVTIEGSYFLKLAISSAATAPALGVTFFVYKNGTKLRSGAFFPAASPSGYYAFGVWSEYLVPGDYVQIGYLTNTATANQFAGGDLFGANIFFQITLQSRTVT